MYILLKKQLNTLKNSLEILKDSESLIEKQKKSLEQIESYVFKEEFNENSFDTYDEENIKQLALEFINSLEEPLCSLFNASLNICSKKFVKNKSEGFIILDEKRRKLKITCGIDGSSYSLFCYIHELSHAVEYLLNSDIFNICENSYFSEMFPRFMEFLLIDYLLEQNFSEDELKVYMNYRFSNEIQNINFLKFVNTAIKCHENELLNKEDIKLTDFFTFKELIHLYSYFLNDYKLKKLIKYNNSFVAAIDLYEVYSKNKSEGLKILLNYLKMDKSNNKDVENYLNNFCFNSKNLRKTKV